MNKLKENLFLVNFPNFGAKKAFAKNAAVMQNFIRASSTMAKFREI